MGYDGDGTDNATDNYRHHHNHLKGWWRHHQTLYDGNYMKYSGPL